LKVAVGGRQHPLAAQVELVIRIVVRHIAAEDVEFSGARNP